MLSAEKIKSNWELHLKIIETYITDKVQKGRKNLILTMLSKYEDRLILAPASTKTWFHNSFPGGYIDHVNRVVKLALQVSNLYKESHGTINFSEESLVMAAVFHDFGKMGNEEHDCYIKQTDSWRRDKLQENYTINPELGFMLIPDRSLYLLQVNGIKLSEDEYLGIKLHDGVFEDGNKPYFVSFNEHSRMKSNIVTVLHMADYMASKVEYDIYKLNKK